MNSNNFKTNRQAWLALAPVVLVVAFLVLSSVMELVPGYGVYDGKRLVQLWLLAALPALTLLSPVLRGAIAGLVANIPKPMTVALMLFFLLGLASALAHPPWFYPLVDVALLFMLGVAVLVLAACRAVGGTLFDRIALGGVAFFGAAVALQESMGFAAGMVTGHPYSYDIMLVHFAHPRFYNDLQTFSIPLLAALPWVFGDSRKLRVLAVLLLALQWCLLFISGGRGSTLGLAVALLLGGALLWQQRPRWLRIQLLGLATGALLFAGILGLQGRLFDDSPVIDKLAQQSLGRYTAPHSSGRDRLWSAALEQSRQHPWLGIGPARFACIEGRGMVAHPHNFALQLAAEWGWPATLLMAGIVGWLGWRMLAGLLRPPPDPACEPLRQVLSLSLLALAVHALFSGVLVVPVGQTAVAIAGGWLLGQSFQVKTATRQQPISLVLLPLTLLGIWLAVVGGIEAQSLLSTELFTAQELKLAPRFWWTGEICAYEQ